MTVQLQQPGADQRTPRMASARPFALGAPARCRTPQWPCRLKQKGTATHRAHTAAEAKHHTASPARMRRRRTSPRQTRHTLPRCCSSHTHCTNCNHAATCRTPPRDVWRTSDWRRRPRCPPACSLPRPEAPGAPPRTRHTRPRPACAARRTRHAWPRCTPQPGGSGRCRCAPSPPKKAAAVQKKKTKTKKKRRRR